MWCRVWKGDGHHEVQPPTGTELLRLPNHIVPAPVGVADVEQWLRPAGGHHDGGG